MIAVSEETRRDQLRAEALAETMSLALPTRPMQLALIAGLLKPSVLSCPDCAAREAEAIARAVHVTGGPENPVEEQSTFAITTWRPCPSCNTSAVGA